MDKCNFEILKKYFEEMDQIYIALDSMTERTSIQGTFYPSCIEKVNRAINKLIEKEIIDINSWFGDAGCGDGRIISLTSMIHGIKSIGIEGDDKYVKLSNYNIGHFKEIGLGNGVDFLVVEGDFTEDSTYEKAGIKFEDISTFFNFYNGHNGIASKILNQSPKGTVFIFYKPRNEDIKFEGLKLYESMTLRYPREKIPDVAFIDVYIKS